ncbi:AcrR family transcriptional regulator [Naumannella cuiyingiana]|uniref:AcrR family transcriptional regulator n=1 Tax=Naumannella cuiyingiana TaxID=1347891 RepID=A0A7Z0IKF2_9ACTN|nr:TetR/AcrR family transcriptional regulator [Naumannella cuiyingiana]NYI70549.1 AcrR family transcriptional regulator [Naumannella cuiyingiana]
MDQDTNSPTKDRLLAAARACLLRRGYAGTTVRELIAESGTNQASINYHFGSKEVLLNQAVLDLNGEWGRHLFDAVGGELSATERWRRVIDSIEENRSLWFVNFEAITLAQHNETIRQGLAERGARAREVLAEAFGGDGSRQYALLIGVAAQWLLDPDTAPSAEAIAGGAAPG